MRVRRQSPSPRRYGLTLVEAMLLLVIVSIVAVAAGVGLQAVVKVPANADDMMAINSLLVSGTEQMKAQLMATSPGWPSTTGTTTYSFTLVTKVGTTTFGLPTSTSLTTDGNAWTTTLKTQSTTTVGNTSLVLNGKYYYMSIILDKADPGGGLKYDFLKLTAQLYRLDGSTVPSQSMVTYVTKP